jgi:hypothetical protein
MVYYSGGTKMAFWNRGGGPSGQGTPAEENDTVIGEVGPYVGSKGEVLESKVSFGDGVVKVKWTSGPRKGTTEWVKQSEVGGTTI